MKNKSKLMKKFKYGTIATVTVVIVLAIVVLINIIMAMVTEKYPVKFDLTQDKRYELSQESIDFLNNLDSEVEIAVTLTKEELNNGGYVFKDSYKSIPTEIIPQFLEKYKMYADNIDIKYIDVEKNPDEISKYTKLYEGTISAQQVIVCSGDRIKVIGFGNLFSQSSSQYASQNDTGVIFTGESAITSAIMSVTDANPISAGMIYKMNGQAIFSQSSYNSIIQFYSLLNNNGYNMKDVDIATDELSPDDYDLLVISASEVDFTEDEIAKLEDFLYNNGDYQKNIIYISSIVAADTPNLDEFLEKWNIKIEDSLVFDDQNSQYVSTASAGQIMGPVMSIVDDTISGMLANKALPVVAPYSRAVTVVDKNNDKGTEVILQSSASSYRNALESADDKSTASENGSNNIIVITTKDRAEGYDMYESHVVAVGAVMLTDPNIIAQTTAYNNANFVLNMVNNITGKDSSFVIPQKNLQQIFIKVDQSQLSALRIVVMYVIPSIVVVCGIVVFVRRKNK